MQAIIAKLKNDGQRLTKIRLAIIELLVKAKQPLTQAQILQRLAGLDLKANRTTVYRELGFLLNQKLASLIKFTDHKNYYEISSTHHHHLVCTVCKQIKEVVLDKHLEGQEKKIFSKEKFKVFSHSLEFYGLCYNCFKKQSLGLISKT